jgi:hypothetical protein
LNLKPLLSSIAADTSTNTSRMTRVFADKN